MVNLLEELLEDMELTSSDQQDLLDQYTPWRDAD